MTEGRKHQLDKLAVTDILSYLGVRVFDMEEHIRREKKPDDELKRFLALWENTVCEIRAENKVCGNHTLITHLCDKLENSMVAYSQGNVEYAHFVI